MMELTDDIRKELQACRERFGLSSQTLAQKLGVSRTTLRRWEVGRTSRLSVHQYLKLQEFLNEAPLDTKRPPMHPTLCQIREIYTHLPKEFQKKLQKELTSAIQETLTKVAKS